MKKVFLIIVGILISPIIMFIFLRDSKKWEDDQWDWSDNY
jgi:hypothetical protein